MGVMREEEQHGTPGSAPSVGTLAARMPLSASERRAMVNTITAPHLVTMMVCAGIAYLGLSAGQWSTDLNQTDLTLMTMYGLHRAVGLCTLLVWPSSW
jgi:hypothetical protein